MNSTLLPDSYFIRPFDLQHAFYLGSFLIILSLVLLNHKKIAAKPEPIWRAALVLTIIQQFILYGSYLLEGFNLAEALPLHISRVSSLIAIAWLVSRKTIFMDLLFFFGLYAYGSFFYPSRIHPITHPIGWSFLINHVVTILLPITVIIAGDWKPSKQSLYAAMRYFLLYLAAAMLANAWTGGNYFYMTRRIAFMHLALWQYTILIIAFTFMIFVVIYFISRKLINLYRRRHPSSHVTRASNLQ